MKSFKWSWEEKIAYLLKQMAIGVNRRCITADECLVETYCATSTRIVVTCDRKSKNLVCYGSFACLFRLQGDPVIPAFPDLHLAPASILKELAPYFQKVSAQVRHFGLSMPHELSPREASEYPPCTRPLSGYSQCIVFVLVWVFFTQVFFVGLCNADKGLP